MVLVVLDGWGFRPGRDGNAIELGQTPVWHQLWERAPRTLLEASGLAVGLPEGQIGNSEVGHLNLGAGRVVPQDLVRISQSVEAGEFFRIPALVELVENTRRHERTLHVIGLIGTGGVHALDKHLYALIDLAERRRVAHVAIHALLDGRDTMPRSALGFMRDLIGYAKGRAHIASMGGRYFGMDRDKRWDRIEKWYNAAVRGVGPHASDPLEVVRQSYERDITDEFVEPLRRHYGSSR